MDKHVLNTIDAVVIGERLAEARRARGLTQLQTAEAIGAARTTIVAIENGVRRPRAAELVKLANLYGRSVGEFVRAPVDATRPNFLIHFRAARTATHSNVDAGRDADIHRFENLCRWYVELEDILGAPLPKRYPEQYDISGTSPERAAEEVANSERNRLSLGDGPIGDLWSLFESDIGLRLFSFPMTDASIAGMFLYSENYGGCIVINANHPDHRRRLSGAHEYAHFLTDRQKPEITIVQGTRAKAINERFADAFARFFLMPASGLIRRFESIRRAKNDRVTPADVLMLSHLYQVSFQAMMLRIEELKLLPNGSWDLLQTKGFKPGRAREILFLDADANTTSKISVRYSTLAIQAYEQGLLTEGQLAERLGTDRIGVRDRIHDLTTLWEVRDDGVWKQAPLDLSINLAEKV